MLVSFFTFAQGQNPSGVSISWNASVGCQTYGEELRVDKDPIFIENIANGTCINVCAGSQVSYLLSGVTPTNPNTV